MFGAFMEDWIDSYVDGTLVITIENRWLDAFGL